MFGKKENQPASEREISEAIENANRQNAGNTRILAMLAADYLKERKTKRRWGWVFKGFIVVYLFSTLFLWFNSRAEKISGPHTALVELNGLIAPTAASADSINENLRRAFAAKSAVGVVLRIDSPGGTPVQAAKINAEIIRLKELYPEKPFYVVIADICASGGYYVAVAADEIYGHPSSIVGSIGVRMDGFGFVDTMQKLGVERRLITAGANKGILDPFSPMLPDQKAHAEAMIGEVHQQFIDAVKRGRGDKLQPDPEIFSGLFWSGEKAKALGLIDGFAGVDEIARDKIHADHILTYRQKESLLEQFAREVGVTISTQLFGNGISLR